VGDIADTFEREHQDRIDVIRSIKNESPEMRHAGGRAIERYLEGSDDFGVVASAVWSAMINALLDPKAPGSAPGCPAPKRKKPKKEE